MTRAAPEQALARQVVAFFHAALPPEVFWTALNPVPAKSKAVAGLSKSLGMKRGAPDYLLVWQGRVLFVELKSDKGRLSEAQRECHDAIERADAGTLVCWSIVELAGWLTEVGHRASR